MCVCVCVYIYIHTSSATNGYVFFFHYKGEPSITPTSGICKQTSCGVCADLSTYFVFILMLSISDLILSWKSFFVYFIVSLYDTSKDNHDSCFVLTFFVKSLHMEEFKTDLTFSGILSKHPVKRSSTPKGKRILHFSGFLSVILGKSAGE